MGLLDDWMDLKWRYKAFMPLIAALPLIYYAKKQMQEHPYLLPFIGTIHFGSVYFYIIIPLIVMIVTNTVNQLGGLNGLETICPAIVILGLMAAITIIHSNGWSLNILANFSLLQLSRQNFRGKLRLIRHRNDNSFIRRDFRLKIELADFNFALHFQFFINTVDGLLYTQKSQSLV